MSLEKVKKSYSKCKGTVIKYEDVNDINELLVKTMDKSGKVSRNDDDDDGNGGGNSGKLLIDATTVPADIKYPTDLDLLNTAREKSEHLIDELHEGRGKSGKKPHDACKT